MKKTIILSFAILTAVLMVVAFLFASFFLNGQLNLSDSSIEADLFPKNLGLREGTEAAAECFVAEEHTVRGDSLSGIVESGETVNVLLGYYDCHEIKREDIVAYDYAGNENPVIKVVKALPSDSFSLKESKEGFGWNLFVNGKIAANSENQPYLLNESRYKMPSLYERDYNGVVPENSYLLLGNVASGSLDSTVFGLVHKSDILGKMEKVAS